MIHNLPAMESKLKIEEGSEECKTSHLTIIKEENPFNPDGKKISSHLHHWLRTLLISFLVGVKFVSTEATYSDEELRKYSTFDSDIGSHLNTYKWLHINEKPFQCNICNKKFKLKGSLQKHLRIHSGEKLFHCDTCNRNFSQKGHLEEHIRIHSGERPFHCNICDRKFTLKSGL